VAAKKAGAQACVTTPSREPLMTWSGLEGADGFGFCFVDGFLHCAKSFLV